MGVRGGESGANAGNAEGGRVEKGHPGKGVPVREGGGAGQGAPVWEGGLAGQGAPVREGGRVGQGARARRGPGGPGSGSAKQARAFAAAIGPVPIETPPLFQGGWSFGTLRTGAQRLNA